MNMLPVLMFILTLIGLGDAIYLTIEHYRNIIPPCEINIGFIDCGQVLNGPYATILGQPVALLGLIYYAVLFISFIYILTNKSSFFKQIAINLSAMGFVFSMYLVFLMAFVIKAICLYCFVSALISTLLFIMTRITFPIERRKKYIFVTGILYKYILKPLLFCIDPEIVHEYMTLIGKFCGTIPLIRNLISYAFNYSSPLLKQTHHGITYTGPIGLSAGFDYKARLPRILPSLGFGFGTIGTITNLAYEGNPLPRLGRLPKSQSLLVNKGFKNAGSIQIIKEIENIPFTIPIGISIGRTNSKSLKTQKDSVKDIVTAFKKFEKSKVQHAYYELNISCPNLIHGDISFYSSKNLEELLIEMDLLKLHHPLYIKMPIDKTNEETKEMLDVIVNHNVQGVIFGNLQRNRKDPSFDKEEIKSAGLGNFSGKPTEKRSDELISLAYKHAHNKLLIIGCGGVFSAEDAYRKIKLGASLIQLITGMIYEGPQLISNINFKLIHLIKNDGYISISEAIGSNYKRK